MGQTGPDGIAVSKTILLILGGLLHYQSQGESGAKGEKGQQGPDGFPVC